MFSEQAYQAARHRAAAIERVDRGLIVVSGQDRASYLQGLLTNDIARLTAGEGCYAAYLTPQGRMIADALVYELGDVILMAVPLPHTASVLAKLDQLVFGEDVRLGDVTATFSRYAVIGPATAAVLHTVLGEGSTDLESLPEHGNRRVRFGGHPSVLTRVDEAGEPGFDLYVERSQREALQEAIRAAGVPFVDAETADVIRIEAGIPKFDQDMDQDTIPLEAGIEGRAISFSKGCYVGQEVIVRVVHRGHGRVARKLAGLALEGPDLPIAGAAVTADGRQVGRVTSSAHSPALGRPIALAYLHRDALEAGTVVSVNGARAVVTTLPFVEPAKVFESARRLPAETEGS
jgi:folate-binding protein YgfZ